MTSLLICFNLCKKENKIGIWQTKTYHWELGLPGTELFYSSFIINMLNVQTVKDGIHQEIENKTKRGQKRCTRIFWVVSHSSTLFKGYKCHKLYEIIPKGRFLGCLRKNEIYGNWENTGKIVISKILFCGIWSFFSRVPIRTFSLELFYV